MLRMESCISNHAPYCFDCICRHVATKLHGGGMVTTVGCPGVGCCTVIELESCRPLLSKGVIEQWEELLCRELIGKSEVYYCPFKNCSAMLVVEVELSSMRESECPHCHRLFCAQCGVVWHSGFDCQGFKRLSEADEKGKEDIVVNEMAKSNKWGRCPRCKFYVERIEGCPHINCRCRYEFCYGCGADWSRYHGGCSRN
ncbi:E3 ubiquitin-protein ligase RSL1 [Linum grandiflorum]